MAAFFRDVGWSGDATADSVLRGRADDARENPGAFGVPAPTFLVLSEERVLGYVSSIPTRIWSGGQERPAHWIKGLMVRPEHRNGPLGFHVLKEAARHLPRAIATVVHPAARRLFGSLGFEDLGALSNHVRVLRPTRVLRRLDPAAIGLEGVGRGAEFSLRLARRSGIVSLVGGLAAATQAAWISAAGRERRAQVRRSSCDSLPERPAIDELWATLRPTLGGACVRDGAFLHWRYLHNADTAYRFVAAYAGRGLAGLAVVRPPRLEGDGRLRGIRVATLSDLLVPLDSAGIALSVLAEVERLAARLGADALLCSTSSPALRRLLSRRAYLAVPGNLHFFVQDRETPRTLPDRMESWWLARGDGESDGTF